MSYDDDKIEEIKKQLKQQLIADGWTPPSPDDDKIEEIKKQLIAAGWQLPLEIGEARYSLRGQLIAEGWRPPPVQYPKVASQHRQRVEDIGPLGYEGKRQPPQEKFTLREVYTSPETIGSHGAILIVLGIVLYRIFLAFELLRHPINPARGIQGSGDETIELILLGLAVVLYFWSCYGRDPFKYFRY